jgi:hypothetical protein
VASAALDNATVEARIRNHIAGESGPRASFYKRLTGVAQFWSPDRVAGSHPAEFLDQQGECQRVSLSVAEKYSLDVVVGWVLIENGALPWHCFNRDPASGELIDAARVRGHGLGYVGKVLAGPEVVMLARSAAMPNGRELASNLAETASVISGTFSRIFGG